MAVKNNRRTKVTKMLLKSSLIELMHEKSISQITIREICDAADLNRSTFYLHYTDQFALLSDIENEIMENTFEYLKDVGSNLDTLTYIETFLHYVKKNQDIFETLLCRQENISFQTLFIKKTMDRIKGNLPSLGSIEKEKYIYTFVMHGCVHIIMEWISADFDLSEADIAAIIFKLCDQVRVICKD